MRRPGLTTVAALVVCSLVAAQMRGKAQSPPAPGEANRERFAGANNITDVLQEAEARLARGDVQRAGQVFEDVTRRVHAAAAELGLVRAHMQAGEYRHALALAAHAAGEHLETPGGSALYAWLLRIGGQSQIAARLCLDASTRVANDAVVREACARIAEPWPKTSELLLDPPFRAAPYSWGAAVPPGAFVAGTGVLVSEQSALVPAKSLDGSTRLWLRNGLGQTAEGVIEQRLGGGLLVKITLLQRLHAPPEIVSSDVEPFAGSPTFTAEYALDDQATAAWPLLRQGFFGRVSRDGSPRSLGIDLPPGPRGGPVFDRAGRVVGIALNGGDGADRVIFGSQFQGALDTREPPATSRVGRNLDMDEIYERALLSALQVVRATR